MKTSTALTVLEASLRKSTAQLSLQTEKRLDLLSQRCRAKIKDFESFGEVFQTSDGIYIYRNKGAKVLGVAHLDTAVNNVSFRWRKKRGLVFSPQLDDRLGAWVLLDILPELGIEFDLLLTEGEETGKTTARGFKTDTKYNWVFSFDRRGDEVVLYQYEDEATKKAVEKHGFKVGFGSFSDIRALEDLGVKGFNFGVGYDKEHSENCHAYLDVTQSQIEKFVEFYKEFVDKKLPHTKKTYTYENYQGGNYNGRVRYNNTWRGYSTHSCWAQLRYQPTIEMIIGDRIVIVPLARVVGHLSLAEVQSLIEDEFSEVIIPDGVQRALLKEAYGDDEDKKDEAKDEEQDDKILTGAYCEWQG